MNWHEDKEFVAWLRPTHFTHVHDDAWPRMVAHRDSDEQSNWRQNCDEAAAMYTAWMAARGESQGPWIYRPTPEGGETDARFRVPEFEDWIELWYSDTGWHLIEYAEDFDEEMIEGRIWRRLTCGGHPTCGGRPSPELIELSETEQANNKLDSSKEKE